MLSQRHRHFGDLIKKSIDFIKVFLAEIFKIECDVKMRLNFGGRTMCLYQKTSKIIICSPTISLGDICHHRNRCTSDLIS